MRNISKNKLLFKLKHLIKQINQIFIKTAEVNKLNQHIPFIVQFIESIAADEDRSEGTVSACAGLIGFVNLFI